ncbi:hypothetical protein BD410DRAFT_793366 [Rickenella mellea]|uniref:Nephrocystin 3-like N-terminal domain-containing protein n=1 Tax=Rickenella mellea TaxID=50990 RepID=A0A4Y7PUW6_9AGAM|nr:hypothetical protein BD410DRAFT_793366 [Rickenella mellea]
MKVIASAEVNETGLSILKILSELEELFGRLPSVPNATYNSLARNSVATCLKGTREEFLSKVHAWVENLNQPPVFWLSGLAGTGKTTIAQTIAEYYGERGRLGASFFYSRDQQDRREINHLFPTLALQLGDFSPSLRFLIAKAIKTDKMILRRNWKTQLRCLILEPLAGVMPSFRSPIVVVLDALDECENQETAAEIVRLLITKIHDANLPIKFFITSRPEIELRSMFTSSQTSPATRAVVLHEISESIVQDDLQLYLRMSLERIASKNSDVIKPGTWPTDGDIDRLVKKAGKLFIYAATIVKFLEKSRYKAPDHLRTILTADISSIRSSNPLAALDQLYSQILETAVMAGPEEPDDAASLISRIMGTVVLLFVRLSCQDLGSLLKLRELEVRGALVHLHSLLIVPRDNNLPVQSFHASLHDYLANNKRCTNPKLSIVPPQHHAMIARSCLERMRENLQELIHPVADPMHMVMTCKLNFSRIPRDIKYSCQFWISHLLQVGSPDDDLKRLTRDFIDTALLYWIVVLDAIAGIREQIYVLMAVEGLDFIDGASRTLLRFRIGIVRLKLYQGISFEDTWRKFEQCKQKSPNKPTSGRPLRWRALTDTQELVERLTVFNDVVGSGSDSGDDDQDVPHPRRLRSGRVGSVLTSFHTYQT